MTAPETVVALVLAAGRARRFGGDKLLAPFAGKPVGAHVADTLTELDVAARLAVCPAGDPARAALFRTRGFEIVWNDDPDQGMGRSLALGAAQAETLRASALLVCLADMPLVTTAHLTQILAAGRDGGIVATEVAGVRMPPALFPRGRFAELMTLEGDRGARALLADAVAVVADAAMVRDIDTRADLEP